LFCPYGFPLASECSFNSKLSLCGSSITFMIKSQTVRKFNKIFLKQIVNPCIKKRIIEC
jgi:hypothetical protein